MCVVLGPVVEVDEADSESEDEGEVTSPVKAAETQSNAAVSADTLPTDAGRCWNILHIRTP